MTGDRRKVTAKPYWRYGLLIASIAVAVPAVAQSVGGPVQLLRTVPIQKPIDRPFAGTIELEVDATDIAHRLFVISERVPVQNPGPMTLLYPRWEAASHGPSLSVTNLAGLEISAGGHPIPWRRDPAEPHAFHLDVPAGVRMVEIRFQIVATADQLSPDVVAIAWQRLVLYPAGWYARNIAVAASVALPEGLQPFTSLDTDRARLGRLKILPVSLERLLDSPVLAGRYTARVPLGAPGESPVMLDLVAPGPDDLVLPPARIDALRRMVGQARTVFGNAPFRRYEILARMSEDGSTGGSEHRRSSEIGIASDYFRNWDEQLNNRDIVAHEFVHAWNGLYRVPADLWAPTPNVPQGGSLLWAYEGQTEFWGRILAARAGLRSREETLDKLALDAAEAANRPGRTWRPLSDDVTYPSFMLRQPVPWRDWQRRKDYYLEGVLLWLDVDAILREHSGGTHGIDDFAHAFFADATPDAPARTYDLAALCAALDRIAPFDWRGFFRRWIDGHAEVNVLAGLERQGWRLVYTDAPTPTFRQNEEELGGADLSYSIGLIVGDDGRVAAVSWNGPAFQAGLAPGARILTVAGVAYSRAALIAAVRNSANAPVNLSWDQDGRRITRTISYDGGLRYPRLAAITGRSDTLAKLLSPR
jgi:predicted metalloprotease with PDZ domain